MTSGVWYRDADYDIDKHIDRTASWPDGLHEGHRFVPHLCPTVRRTSSSDDIARYERYFALARTNRGKFFTWSHYLKILGDDLRHFDTVLIMAKMMLFKVATPVSSEISNYATASEFEMTTKRSGPERSKRKKRPFIKRETVGGDGESISSVDSISSNASLTPQTNLLKKMCSEIRTLARKTCKTVERISTKSKYCSACGDFIGNAKVHKKCSQSFGDVTDSPKTPTPSSKVLRIQSMVFDSPARTPVGGGESFHSATDLTFAPHAFCRTKPVIKEKNLDAKIKR